MEREMEWWRGFRDDSEVLHLSSLSFDNTETYEYILTSFDEETNLLLLNISFGTLALCLEEKKIPLRMVEMFVDEILYYQYPYRRHFSFETNSYSILALTCLHRCVTHYRNLQTKLFVAMEFSVKGLLQWLKPDGSFGDIVNTTLAIQAMGVDMLVHRMRYNCRRSLNSLIMRTQSWSAPSMTPEAVGLVIEALEGKTYLDINEMNCKGIPTNADLSTPDVTTETAPSLEVTRTSVATGTEAQPADSEKCCISADQRPFLSLLVSVLLQTVGDCNEQPDPSILIALRLARKHNLGLEKQLQDCLLRTYSEKSVGDVNFTTGAMGLYAMAFRAACLDPANIPNNNLGFNLLRLLEATLTIEMHSLDSTEEYFTDPSQVSLAVLALCLENEEISVDVAHSFVSFIVNLEAPESRNMSLEAKCNYVLALSCLLHSQSNPDIVFSRMQVAIELLLTDLTQNIQLDGSFGNAYETGVVIQVLNAKLGPRLAMARNIYNCSQSLQSMLEAIVSQTPPDIMAVTAALPAMEGRSYLDIKHVCGSDDSPCPDTSNLGQEPPSSRATEDNVARRSSPTIALK
ncbi:uncharacterized protein [Scyliorhinus torazame]|uniref:uncharacterized protein n=1 Tax=Scyliorhinus torazame TaxID=75743 RepID=UPI003B5C54D4